MLQSQLVAPGNDELQVTFAVEQKPNAEALTPDPRAPR